MFEMAEKSALTFPEFMWAIQREDAVAKVLWVLRNRQQELKVLFYSLLRQSPKLGLQQMLDGIGISGMLNDWGISIEEIAEVLTANLYSRSDFVTGNQEEDAPVT